MKRQGKELNTDPERARKRATADLRCAVRKLGVTEAIKAIALLSDLPAEAIARAVEEARKGA